MLAAWSQGRLGGASMGFLAAAAALAYFDFAIVRQTFCKYLCPYARFQSVLLDGDSLVVAYDPGRGEPRGKRRKGAAPAGDCVDCGLCQAVCPTGIDIRQGLQMECIGCTQCIDACDGVMDRLGRAPGLIAYRSLASLEGRRTRLVRARVLAYGGMLAAVVAAFVAVLAGRAPLDLQVEHNASALYQVAADGRLSNAYTLHVQNRDRRDHVYRIRLEAPDGYELVAGVNPLLIAATDSVEARVFVLLDEERDDDDRELAPGPTPIRFVLEQLEPPMRTVERDSTFMAPVAARREDEPHEG